jgi:hypothetical protein
VQPLPALACSSFTGLPSRSTTVTSGLPSPSLSSCFCVTFPPASTVSQVSIVPSPFESASTCAPLAALERRSTTRRSSRPPLAHDLVASYQANTSGLRRR